MDDWLDELEGFELDTTNRLNTLSFLFNNYFTNKDRSFFLLHVGKKRNGLRINNPPHRLNIFEDIYREVKDTSYASLARGSFSPMVVSPQAALILSDSFVI